MMIMALPDTEGVAGKQSVIKMASRPDYPETIRRVTVAEVFIPGKIFGAVQVVRRTVSDNGIFKKVIY